MGYKIGYTFGENEAFEVSNYCNENGLMIIELEPDDNGRRRFKIAEMPKPTSSELIQIEINKLKLQLQNTDYKAIKFAEGLIGNKEYEQIKAERQSLRDKINQLKKDIN